MTPLRQMATWIYPALAPVSSPAGSSTGVTMPLTAEWRAVAQPSPHESADYALAPGLSLHLFGGHVGVYGARIESGKGFAEMPAQDLLTLCRFLQGEEGQQLVRVLESLARPA